MGHPLQPVGVRHPQDHHGPYVLVTVWLALAYVAIVALLYLALPGVVLKFSMAAFRMSDEIQTINCKATSDRSPRSRHQNDLPVRVPLEYFLMRRSHIGQREGLIDDDLELTFLHKGHQLQPRGVPQLGAGAHMGCGLGQSRPRQRHATVAPWTL